MSDFWQRALGTTAAAAPRDEAPLDAWWAPPRTTSAPRDAPAPQAPQAPPAPPAQAQSARATDRCPECSSGDYFKPSPEAKPRCYTCGYPVRHSTSGMTTDRTAASTPARQVETGGFKPQQIIGRVQ